jgi:hypothetical protein
MGDNVYIEANERLLVENVSLKNQLKLRNKQLCESMDKADDYERLIIALSKYRWGSLLELSNKAKALLQKHAIENT